MSAPAATLHHIDHIDDLNRRLVHVKSVLKTVTTMCEAFIDAPCDESQEAWEGLAHVAEDLYAHCEKIGEHANAIHDLTKGGS
jgi:hypothetical protein